MNAKAVIKNIVHKGKAAVSKAQKPKVVVIVPVYNVEKYLPDCKASLDAQTEQDFSVIAVDDGSTDGSGAFLDAWAKADKRVHVIHQSNAGQGSARNTALKHLCASCRQHNFDAYILFLDADDLLASDAIQKVQTKMFESALDVCEFECAVDFSSESLLQQNKGMIEWLRMHGDYSEVLSGPEYITKQKNDHKAVVWSRAYRAGYLFANDLWFTEGYIHEDIAFAFRSILCAHRVACLHVLLYTYRMREGSTVTADKGWENLKGRFRGVCDMLHEIARHSNLTSAQVSATHDIISECLDANHVDYLTLNADLVKQKAREDLGPAEEFLFFKLLLP